MPAHLAIGANIIIRRIKVALKGIKRYDGNAEQICRQCIKECYNGRHFIVSRNNYPHFWTRDFGICIESLIKLGYKKEVAITLEYAMNHFSKDKIGTTIRNNKVFEFSGYSPDSLVFFLRSLRIAYPSLISENKDFLNREIERFYNIATDKETGLIKNNAHFSGMRDYSRRPSSCYNNVMAAALSNELSKLNLDNPLKAYNYRKILRGHFWNGSFFEDSIERKGFVSADANVLPFWLDIFDSRQMIKSSIAAIRQSKLDKPFPLKYVPSNINEKMIPAEIFVRGWQRDAIWSQLGFMYIDVVKKVDKKLAGEYMEQYRKVIEKNRNFLEVFDKLGKPFNTPFFYADEGMLWASLFLK